MKLSSLKVDTAKEKDGVWVQLDIGEDVWVRVRSSDCPQHQKRTRTFAAKHWRQMSSGKIDPTLEWNETGKALAETVLLDWKGLLDDDGKEIPFSLQFATELMTNREFKEFRKAVVRAADDEANFQAEVEAQALGN
jgi:hypothetical protein